MNYERTMDELWMNYDELRWTKAIKHNGDEEKKLTDLWRRWLKLPSSQTRSRPEQVSSGGDGGGVRAPVLMEASSSNGLKDDSGERKKKKRSRGHGVKMDLGPLWRYL